MGKKQCDDCGAHIENAEVFRHEEKEYCAKCIAEHIKEQHLSSSEAKRLFTYKTV